jgi:hypothetical protein
MSDELLERPMRIERGDLVNLEILLDTVARDKRQPKGIQRDAAHWASVVDDMLAYGSPSPELVPIGFQIPDHYQVIFEMTEAELPDDVKAEIPGQLAIARQMAERADDDSFCIDYRLDCLRALEGLLAGIQSQGSDELVES